MTAAAGAVPDRDLRPRQPFEQRVQGGLVGLHGDHQLPAAGVHGVGMADLGVQRIRHDDGAGERAERAGRVTTEPSARSNFKR